MKTAKDFKFRVWTASSEMFYGDTPFVSYVDQYHYQDCPVMQFTSMKDSEGTDIYEGDIVQYSTQHSGDTYSERCIVEYNPEFAWFCCKTVKGHHRQTLGAHKHLEVKVLGNIYENPELLEDK